MRLVNQSADDVRRQVVGAVARCRLAPRFRVSAALVPPAREPDQQAEADAGDAGGDRPDDRVALLHGDDRRRRSRTTPSAVRRKPGRRPRREVRSRRSRRGPSRAGCCRRGRSRRCRRPSGRSPAAQSRIAAWKTSVPTTFFGVRRKTAISRIAITVPEPAEVIPITKPVVAPIATAATLWRRSTSKSLALFDQVAEDQRPRQGDDPDHQQGAAEHRVDDRVEPLFADRAPEDRDRPDAADRGRDAAGGEPRDQPHVDRAHPQVAPAADVFVTAA